ncbi:MAG: protein phosphatase 2C domain-containing protein [Chloroflexi bacterium]|nr:protein phosphatase 2C domain-containing protein [Chloroflexota bacterium]
MSQTVWRFTLASVVGTSHAKLAVPCQDASDCEVMYTAAGEPVLVAIVSDGAGSAARAEVGATLACELFLGEMYALFAAGGTVQDVSRDFVCDWVKRFQEEIAAIARPEGLWPRDFACTVLAAIVGIKAAVFFQIGDGAIVVSSQDEPQEYNWVFWPQKGEYENTTVFATDPESLDYLEHEMYAGSISEIALFTDGLQRLALHFPSQIAYAPFFRAMFAPLRVELPGFREKLSHLLATFLGSSQVNSRTDDDKTLILATRRATTALPTAGESAHDQDGSM